MKWFEPRAKGDGDLEKNDPWPHQRWDIPNEWLPIHYFEAINCLFRIENALRLLVYIALKREFGKNWANINLATDDSQMINLSSIAKKRAANDQKFEYLVTPLACPLMYLTAGELVGLILSDSYWKLFKRYFPGAPSVMETKLQEIACIRNALAHFRPVTTEQVSIIKQNGTQILKKFQAEFDELIFAPRGTRLRPWEVSVQVNGLAGPMPFACSACTSPSDQWVFLEIRSEAQLVDFETVDEKCTIRVRILDMEKLLSAFPTVRSHCVVAFEECLAPNWDGDSHPPPIVKVVRFAIPNKPASKRVPPQETEPFLRNLLVEDTQSHDGPVDIYVLRKVTAREFKTNDGKSSWHIEAHKLIGKALPSEFVENWRMLDGIQDKGESLTSIARYPWMHNHISEPF